MLLQPSRARTVLKGFTSRAHCFTGLFASSFVGTFKWAEMDKKREVCRGHMWAVGVLVTVDDQQRKSPTHPRRPAWDQIMPAVALLAHTGHCCWSYSLTTSQTTEPRGLPFCALRQCRSRCCVQLAQGSFPGSDFRVSARLSRVFKTDGPKG